MPRLKQRHGRFLAALRDDGEFQAPLLDVEHRIRGIALGKQNLILFQLDRSPSHARSFEEGFGIKRRLSGACDFVLWGGAHGIDFTAWRRP
jgi:hypothetical protein